jgi:hypothetical protein
VNFAFRGSDRLRERSTAARVAHLTHHETVTALCEVCGHVAEVRVADFWQRFPSFKRIAEIQLCCTRCGERDRVELDATKALGDDLNSIS